MTDAELREKFEAWAKSSTLSIEKSASGSYRFAIAIMAWQAWQAAYALGLAREVELSEMLRLSQAANRELGVYRDRLESRLATLTKKARALLDKMARLKSMTFMSSDLDPLTEALRACLEEKL